MTKKIFKFTTCIILSVVLAACSSNATSSKSGTSTSSNESAQATSSPSENIITSPNSGEIAIKTESVEVAQYKNLEVSSEYTFITDKEVNDYIQVLIDSVYLPSVREKNNSLFTPTPINNSALVASSNDTNVEEENEADAEKSDEANEADETNEDASDENSSSEENTDSSEAQSSASTGTSTSRSDLENLTVDTLTDTIVQDMTYGEFNKVSDYKEYIKGVLEEQNQSYYEENIKNMLFDEVIKNSRLLKYDDDELTPYVDYANEYYQEYAQYSNMTLEELYKEKLDIETLDEFNEYIRTEAIDNLKRQYVIIAIAEEEDIIVEESEIDAEIQNYIDMGYFASEEEVLDFITKEEMLLNLRYYKVVDLIYENSVTK